VLRLLPGLAPLLHLALRAHGLGCCWICASSCWATPGRPCTVLGPNKRACQPSEAGPQARWRVGQGGHARRV
jgi:hypothetical protein